MNERLRVFTDIVIFLLEVLLVGFLAYFVIVGARSGRLATMSWSQWIFPLEALFFAIAVPIAYLRLIRPRLNKHDSDQS